MFKRQVKGNRHKVVLCGASPAMPPVIRSYDHKTCLRGYVRVPTSVETLVEGKQQKSFDSQRGPIPTLYQMSKYFESNIE